MNIIVDIKNYTPFSYSPYLNNFGEIPKPSNPKYHVGQVVVVDHDDKLQMAVVLGCIDEECGELRLDLCGMTPMEKVRPAKKSDLQDPNIECCKKLRAECEGKVVHYNWETYELTITEKDDQ